MRSQAAPMAAVRELIRQEKRELGLVVLVGGMAGKAACGFLADRIGPTRAFGLIQMLTAAGLLAAGRGF